MSSLRRILLSLSILAIMGGWLLVVAVVSDYNESAVLLVGVLWLLAAFTLSWNARRRWAPILLLTALTLAMLVAGGLAWKAGSYNTRVRQVVAENVLAETARAMERFRAAGHELPDCEWTCLAQQLQDSGAWRGLTIPYRQSNETAQFQTIPRNDGWGCRYQYRLAAPDRFRLRSSGPDRRFETADDIVLDSDGPLPAEVRPLPVFGRRPL